VGAAKRPAEPVIVHAAPALSELSVFDATTSAPHVAEVLSPALALATSSEFVDPPQALSILPDSIVGPAATRRCCELPFANEISSEYLELSSNIGQQLSANYCSVLLLVAVDRWADESFSMTQLAQAFALQSPGDVLLVDGDLRSGQLSRSIGERGPG